jgi:transcriptional regulator with XRE-family HTH domain
MKENEKIKEVRKKLGLTQQHLADKIGVSKQYLSRVENGLTELSKEKVVLLCNSCGISFEWFFSDTGQMLIKDQNIQENLICDTDNLKHFSSLLDVYNSYLNIVSKVVKSKYTGYEIEDEIAVAKFLFSQDCLSENISYTAIQKLKEKFVKAAQKNEDVKTRILATFFYMFTENHNGDVPELCL